MTDRQYKEITEKEEKEVKTFWDNCPPAFAHLELTGVLKDYGHLTSGWDRNFVREVEKRYGWSGKSVMDYGIGGGWLGVHLHKTYGLKNYIGVDISPRQLLAAEKNLTDHDVPHELYEPGFHLNSKDADIFVSQACIQHFPSYEYLTQFMRLLDASYIPVVMLQYRHGDEPMTDERGSYDKVENVSHRCLLNKDYVKQQLRSYEMVWCGDVIEGTQYQYIILELRDQSSLKTVTESKDGFCVEAQ